MCAGFSGTPIIDSAEACGGCVCTMHPTDGRATLVEITAEGRDRALAAAKDLNAAVFESPGFDAEELAELNRMLGQFRRSAGDFA